MKKPVLFLVGPTAVGKSRIAILLARKLKGEIISADSMQVYRGMDIGTAKPGRSELTRIRHHLIDVRSPSRPFSAYDFRRLALPVLEGILKRGHFPIIAGGSGLYVRALLEGLSVAPGSNREVRERLEKEAGKSGLESLYRRIVKIDPLLAKRIDRHNQRRLVRALEIYEVSNQKPSVWYRQRRSLRSLGYLPTVIGLTRDREELYQVINARVDKMVRLGLTTEVRKLMRGKLSRTARQAVGYKELLRYFETRKRMSRDDLPVIMEDIKRNSRRFAKRQWTWFKREKGIEWLDLSRVTRSDDVIRQILSRLDLQD